MASTTNRITLEEATDLFASGARACLAFVAGGRPRVETVSVRYEDSRFLVGVAGRSELPADAAEAVLVVDEGVQFFDLRAVFVRGVPGARRIPDAEGRRWFELQPRTVTCWDYGRLRVADEPR